jgi:hypothetical protein
MCNRLDVRDQFGRHGRLPAPAARGSEARDLVGVAACQTAVTESAKVAQGGALAVLAPCSGMPRFVNINIFLHGVMSLN